MCSNSACTGNETRGGDPKCLLHRERGLCIQGEEGSLARDSPTSSHSTRRSNCSAASNSAFMAAAHSSSSDFWGKRNGGQVSGEAGTLAGAFPPIPCRRRLSPVTARAEPRPCTCPGASPRVSGVTAEEGPCPSLTKISGTFLFFRFSFTAGGEIPGRVVSGAQGFTGTLGTSVSFEPTTGETPAKSSVASSPSKPEQDQRPGVEVEAEPGVSRRL